MHHFYNNPSATEFTASPFNGGACRVRWVFGDHPGQVAWPYTSRSQISWDFHSFHWRGGLTSVCRKVAPTWCGCSLCNLLPWTSATLAALASIARSPARVVQGSHCTSFSAPVVGPERALECLTSAIIFINTSQALPVGRNELSEHVCLG